MRVQDGCEDDNKAFCMIWSTAGYFGELGIGFGAVSCLAILFGVTTHSRRRRIWKSASVLVALHGESMIPPGRPSHDSSTPPIVRSPLPNHCVQCRHAPVSHRNVPHFRTRPSR